MGSRDAERSWSAAPSTQLAREGEPENMSSSEKRSFCPVPGEADSWSRRRFLRRTALTTAGLGLAANLRAEGPVGSNDRIHFGVIGCGGMGTGHVRSLVKRGPEDNVKVLAVCDVYQRRITRAIEASEGGEGYK